MSRLAWFYGLIIVIYLLILLMIDGSKGFFDYLPKAIYYLPSLIIFSLISFFLRYARWFLILRWSGYHISLLRGWLAYTSGFAFTATPGKVGELARIRYFGHMYVDKSIVITGFVFERMLDLVVVFCLSALWVVNAQMFVVAITFVSTFLLLIGFVVFRPKFFYAWGDLLDRNGYERVGRLLNFVVQAISDSRVWLKPIRLVVSLLLGFGAWSIIALAFVYLLNTLHLNVPFLAAFALYPLAMLVGAASMLPGGIGSTETAIIAQLVLNNVPATLALFVAVIIRLGSIWFSVALGFVSIIILSKWKN